MNKMNNKLKINGYALTCPVDYPIGLKITSKDKRPNFSGWFDTYSRAKGHQSVYITKVLYNHPVVVVWWSDGTSTKSKVRGEDDYSREAGLLYCIIKKIAPDNTLDELFKDWLPSQLSFDGKNEWVTLADVRKSHKA